MELDYIQELVKEGAEVYVVGGHIRNAYYNKIHGTSIPIKDTDFLIRLLNEKIITNILKKFGTVKFVGVAFGIITLTLFNTKTSIEFALPRREESTGPQYKYVNVEADENISLMEDFSRRDATINAMAVQVFSLGDVMNMCLDNIIDPFNGKSDIENKLWRAVGDVDKRFMEDSTRIMRAFRQSAELGLTIEENTFEFIKLHSHYINALIPTSYVRLYNELFKMLKYDYCAKYICMMNDCHILKILDIDITGEQCMSLILTHNMRIKLAILFKDKIFDDMINIKLWLNNHQIAATNFLNKYDVQFCDVLKSIDPMDIMAIKSKKDMLIKISIIEKNCKEHGYEFFGNVLEYCKVIGHNDPFIDDIYAQCKNYPHSVDKLKISGITLMDEFKIKQMDIQQTKLNLLHMVYDDVVENNEDCLKIILNGI
jgi:tRNA nucleotidyltransferase/poly(A) polymerase